MYYSIIYFTARISENDEMILWELELLNLLKLIIFNTRKTEITLYNLLKTGTIVV